MDKWINTELLCVWTLFEKVYYPSDAKEIVFVINGLVCIFLLYIVY